ncbi:MAG: hypothetical protein O2809_04170, partial [Proteobacteria bacterium]|nr:hypothetical protein [Pseudomonadota bacterium]
NHTDAAIGTAAIGAGLATKATQGIVTGKGVGGVGLTNVAPMVGRGAVTGGKDLLAAGKAVASGVKGGDWKQAGGGVAKAVGGVVGAAGGHAAKNASIEALSSLKNKLSSHPTQHDRNFGQRMNDRNRADHGTPLKNLAASLKSKMNKPIEQGE